MNFSEKHTSLTVQGSQAAEFLQGQITIDREKILNLPAFATTKAESWQLFGLKR